MSVRTRAKFRCREITKAEGWADQPITYNITFVPVVGGNPENEAFYAATPGGEIKLEVISAAAGEVFQVGKDYYVDFTRAPA